MESVDYQTQAYDPQAYDNYYGSYYNYYQTYPAPGYPSTLPQEEPRFYGLSPDLIMSSLTVIFLLVVVLGFFMFVNSTRSSGADALDGLLKDPNAMLDVYVFYSADKDPAEVHQYLKEKGASIILVNDQDRWTAVTISARGIKRVRDQDWVMAIKPVTDSAGGGKGETTG